MFSSRILVRGIAVSLTLIFSLLHEPPSSIPQPVGPPKLKRLPRQPAPKESIVIPGEVIVKYKERFLPSIRSVERRDKAFKDAAKALRKRFRAETIAIYPELGWVRIKLPAGLSFETVKDALSHEDKVEYSRPNYKITLHNHTNSNSPPADYLWKNHFESPWLAPYLGLSYLWGLEKIGMAQAWNLSFSQGGGLAIAIVDTGVDYNHPDILNNYLSGKSYCTSDLSAMDRDGHGTYVAGIIAARGDNWVNLNDMKSFVGVNKTAQLMAIKTDCGEGPNITDAIAGITYAVSHGAAVINGSWGFYGLPETDSSVVDLKNAIEAGTNTTLYVASAGNDDRDFDSCLTPQMWPQMFHLDNLVVVAATNPGDSLWVTTKRTGSNPCQPTNAPEASNFGATVVHLAAPGEDIWSMRPRSQTGNDGSIYDFVSVASSTSGAAPFVSGCAALLQARVMSINPAARFSPTELRSILMETGDASNGLVQKVASGKRLNCYLALDGVNAQSPPAPPRGIVVR